MNELMKFMQENLPEGAYLEQVRAVLEEGTAVATNDAEVREGVWRASQLLVALNPQPSVREVQAVLLLMIGERIDQVAWGDLAEAMAFSRIGED